MQKGLIVFMLALCLMIPGTVLAANTGNTGALDSQAGGAKVSGAPLSHALGGRGMLFGNTKADFVPPVGWTGEATVENPEVLAESIPGLKGVEKGDVIKIERMGPGKYKLLHPGTGASAVVNVE